MALRALALLTGEPLRLTSLSARTACAQSSVASSTGGDDTVYSGTSAFRGIVPVDKLPALPDPGAIQFWMGRCAPAALCNRRQCQLRKFLRSCRVPEGLAACRQMA